MQLLSVTLFKCPKAAIFDPEHETQLHLQHSQFSGFNFVDFPKNIYLMRHLLFEYSSLFIIFLSNRKCFSFSSINNYTVKKVSDFPSPAGMRQENRLPFLQCTFNIVRWCERFDDIHAYKINKLLTKNNISIRFSMHKQACVADNNVHTADTQLTSPSYSA